MSVGIDIDRLQGRITEVNIADIKQTLFVRGKLNTDWADDLAILVMDGIQLTPILLNEQNELIDGRHRLAAHQIAERTTIKAKILRVTDRAELFSMAYRANLGGKLPPTPEDRELVVEGLLSLEHNMGYRRLAELLGIPDSAAKTAKRSVQTKMARRKLLAAKQAVVNGNMTLEEAAALHGVKLETLQAEISGKRVKSKGLEIGKLKIELTRAQKSASSRRAATLTKLLEAYKEGDVSEGAVSDYLKHAKNSLREATSSLEEATLRAETLMKARES